MQSKIQKLIANPHKYLGKYFKRKYAEAPYPLQYYNELLDELTGQSGVVFHPFQHRDSSENDINVFIRHDIDRTECIENFDQLVELNTQHGLPSALFFLVNDRTYELAAYKEKVLAARAAGAEIGLHTECYRIDDFMGEFHRETKRFEEVLGFRPESFTVHGLGKREDIRQQFYDALSEDFSSTGYHFTDCISGFRTYDYVIEDCHQGPGAKGRFIYTDFKKLPKFLKPGDNLLILTHPCYWKP